VAPFLPVEFKKKGVDEMWTGYVFAIYSLMIILVSPITGPLIKVFGRRKLIVLGQFCMGGAFITFGLSAYLPESKRTLFITTAMLCRTLQGCAAGILNVVMYSICTNFFPTKDTNVIIGYMEATIGLGLCLGPILGTALYAAFGFSGVFLIFGGIFISFSLFIYCIFPKRID
jgi:MFS family permease